ncbi:hypothetical protein WBP07_29510 [Novosphingobium sp. BL-8A]
MSEVPNAAASGASMSGDGKRPDELTGIGVPLTWCLRRNWDRPSACLPGT